MIPFDEFRVVEIVDHNAVALLHTLVAQICAGVDLVNARAITQMEPGDWIRRQYASLGVQKVFGTEPTKRIRLLGD